MVKSSFVFLLQTFGVLHLYQLNSLNHLLKQVAAKGLYLKYKIILYTHMQKTYI